MSASEVAVTNGSNPASSSQQHCQTGLLADQSAETAAAVNSMDNEEVNAATPSEDVDESLEDDSQSPAAKPQLVVSDSLKALKSGSLFGTSAPLQKDGDLTFNENQSASSNGNGEPPISGDPGPGLTDETGSGLNLAAESTSDDALKENSVDEGPEEDREQNDTTLGIEGEEERAIPRLVADTQQEIVQKSPSTVEKDEKAVLEEGRQVADEKSSENQAKSDIEQLGEEGDYPKDIPDADDSTQDNKDKTSMDEVDKNEVDDDDDDEEIKLEIDTRGDREGIEDVATAEGVSPNEEVNRSSGGVHRRKLSRRQLTINAWKSRRQKQGEKQDIVDNVAVEQIGKDDDTTADAKEEEAVAVKSDRRKGRLSTAGEKKEPNQKQTGLRTPIPDVEGNVEMRTLRRRVTPQPVVASPSPRTSRSSAVKKSSATAEKKKSLGKMADKSVTESDNIDKSELVGKRKSKIDTDKEYSSFAREGSRGRRGGGGRGGMVRSSTPQHERVTGVRSPVRTVQSERRPPALHKTPIKGRGRGRPKRDRTDSGTIHVNLDEDEDEDDPYNLINMDNHPNMLENIKFSRGSFNTVTFTKPTPARRSNISSYERTEKAVTEHRSSYGDTPPVAKQARRKRGAAASAQRRRISTSSDQSYIDDMEMDVSEGEMIAGARAHVTPSHKMYTAKASTGRKRKTLDTTESGSAAKRVQKEEEEEEEIVRLSPSEQIEADRAGHHRSLVPGARVLVRWTDKNFYPAHVLTARDGHGCYRVKYLDRKVKRRPANDLLQLALLRPGHQCMVSTEDDELQPIKIVACPRIEDEKEWFEGMFRVHNEITEEEQLVSWEKFVIDRDQTKEFLASDINVARDIVEENISSVEERRSRHSRPSSFTPVAIQQYTEQDNASMMSRKSKTPKKPASKINTPKTSRIADERMLKEDMLEKEQQRRQREEHLIQQERLISTLEGRRLQEDVQSSDSDRVPRTIFKAKLFVLTSANRRVKPPDFNNDQPVPVLFNKKEVRQMIETRGGVVIEDFSNLPKSADVFLVADTHYRTHKYLSALARAVPCVGHQWIHDCAASNDLIPYTDYVLAAGVALENEEMVKWHDRGPTLLKDTTVLVHTENRPAHAATLDFVQIWTPLVRCMGAVVVDQIPEDKLDILMTDNSCSETVLKKAQELGAKAVSSEWLIQAIILGRCPDSDAHPRYKYDYTEQTESLI